MAATDIKDKEVRKVTHSSGYSYEYKLMASRETPVADKLVDTPEKAHAYWQAVIAGNPYYNPDVECFAVLILNTRRHVKGHLLVSTGTMDTILVHPREVFRPAIVAAASAIIIMHNHPSGDPSPSEADIKVTRDLIRAGQVLKIELLDHVIAGQQTPERARPYVSLRELGYFYSS